MREKNLEFKRIVERFFERNGVSNDSSEKYIKNFSNRFAKFLAQQPLKSNPLIKNKVIECIEKDYQYYSYENIVGYLKSFHNKLETLLRDNHEDIEDCYFSNILNKNTFRNNSSNEMVTLYINVNSIPNRTYVHFNDVIDLEVKRQRSPEGGTDDKDYYSNEVCRQKEDWARRLSEKSYLILIDDYTGSGSTIIDFLEMILKYLKSDIKIILFCIHGTTKAYDCISLFVKEQGLVCDIIFADKSEKYFLNSPDNEELFREFQYHYVTSKKKYVLGFKETESVLSTYRNTPNNTLSLFWEEKLADVGWQPLFPREEKIKSKGSVWVRKRKEILWYISYRDIPEFLKYKMIVLIYIKNNDNVSSIISDIELSKIICYNDTLQECISENYLINESSGSYKITESGLWILKTYDLDHVTLKTISEAYQKSGLKRDKINFVF